MKYLYIYLAAVSLAAFIAYGIDKLKAKAGAWRIPEKTLWLFGLAGGAPGALLGMSVFHHKTRKVSFYAVNIFSLCLWAGVIVHVLVR